MVPWSITSTLALVLAAMETETLIADVSPPPLKVTVWFPELTASE